MNCRTLPRMSAFSARGSLQRAQERLQIGGPRGLEIERLACIRVDKLQLSGVQCKSRSATRVFQRRLVVAASIFDVAAYGMPQFCQMDPDLIGSTSLQAALDFRELVELLQHAHVRNCQLAGIVVGRAASQSISSIAYQVRAYRLVRQAARDHCQVLAHGVMLCKLLDNPPLSIFVACKHEQPTGVTIDSMHGIESWETRSQSGLGTVGGTTSDQQGDDFVKRRLLLSSTLGPA